MRRLSSILIALAVAAAGCGPRPADPDEAKTLDAATAAGQQIADRFSAGDFAGVWERSSAQLRAGISREDYVRYAQTCKTAGLPIAVTGVRMDGPDIAILQWELANSGVTQTGTVVYEDGRWREAPEPDFVGKLGKPVEQIIAEQKQAGRCRGATAGLPS